MQGVSWWLPSHLATSVWLLGRQAVGQLFLILDLFHLLLGQLQSGTRILALSHYGEGTGSHGTTRRLPPALPTYPFFPLPGVCEVREGQPEG